MPQEDQELDVFDPDMDDDSDIDIHEYQIVSSPNDFNVVSYFNFFETGSIQIPGFQRHYVWDIRKASKLIESILMGLPIPQIFLYEQQRNKFLVIDGQQRLLTIYYFMKGRFPRRDARAKLRGLFTTQGTLSASDLDNDDYFVKFKLSFKQEKGEKTSPYAGQTYESLGDNQASFQLRTIRNIMVKQVRPEDDNSSIFELFHRLNTGGINLSQQEIRMALFYGQFIRDVTKLNEYGGWRDLLGSEPDQRQKDVEVILRLFAMAERHQKFRKPLSRFINTFCSEKKSEPLGAAREKRFKQFCDALGSIDRALYLEPKSKRVSVPILEAAFVATAAGGLGKSKEAPSKASMTKLLKNLRSHPDFDAYFTGKTTDAAAVKGRIERALELCK